MSDSTPDEARLRESIAWAEASLRRALDSGRSWAFFAPRVPRADLERVLDALSAERAVSQRWYDAYSIAHDQATENGQRLSAERERGDRAVENSMCRIDMDADTDLLDDLAISGDHIKLLRLEDMGDGFWGRVYMRDGSDIVLSIGTKRSRVSVTVERELATQKAEGAET